jgi:5-methylcytosine-specific restriction endonuclease McrA
MTISDGRSVSEGRPAGVSLTETELRRLARNGALRALGLSPAQVCRIARGGKPSKRQVRAMRLVVFPRDSYTCQGCGWQPVLPSPGWDGTGTLIGPEPDPLPRRDYIQPGYRLLTLGHIVPASEDGPFEESNLRAECSRCNYGDSNRIKAAHARGLTLAGDPWP